MAPLLKQEEEGYTGLPLTPDRVFAYRGQILRRNYKTEWWGNDYRILCGRFRDCWLSDIDSEKWLTWALNQFEGQLKHELYRALVDQINSLHK